MDGQVDIQTNDGQTDELKKYNFIFCIKARAPTMPPEVSIVDDLRYSKVTLSFLYSSVTEHFL